MTTQAIKAASTLMPSSKRSKLAPYFDEIVELRNQGYGYNQIADVLLVAYELETSGARICEYLKRHLKHKNAFKTVLEPKPTQTIQNGIKSKIEPKERQIDANLQDENARQAMLERFANIKPKPVQGVKRD
jgi:hypothetical protein